MSPPVRYFLPRGIHRGLCPSTPPSLAVSKIASRRPGGRRFSNPCSLLPAPRALPGVAFCKRRAKTFCMSCSGRKRLVGACPKRQTPCFRIQKWERQDKIMACRAYGGMLTDTVKDCISGVFRPVSAPVNKEGQKPGAVVFFPQSSEPLPYRCRCVFARGIG